MSPASRAAMAAILVFSCETGVLAQDIPLSTPTPVPVEPAPVAVPTPVPSPAPTPVPVPTPAASATPRAAPRAAVEEAARPAVARATPTPTLTPTPTPIETPAPAAVASPEAGPTPDASLPGAGVPAVVAPLPTAAEPVPPRWPWMLGAAVVALGVIGLWLARRRPAMVEEPVSAGEAPVVMPPPAVAATPRARLALAFRPARVGFNMLSATVEGELTVANEGDGEATDVRVRAGLLGAHAGQEEEIAAFAAEPIGRPAVAAFALAPGERRTMRIVAATAREGMRTMTAAGRPMFVPVLAINVRTAGEGQVVQAYAVGVERVDSAKLAPFWLDVPDRAYTAVAARPHGTAVER